MFLRPLYRLLRYSEISSYTPNPTVYKVPTAYMLLEYIDPGIGQMLSDTCGTSGEKIQPVEKGYTKA